MTNFEMKQVLKPFVLHSKKMVSTLSLKNFQKTEKYPFQMVLL